MTDNGFGRRNSPSVITDSPMSRCSVTIAAISLSSAASSPAASPPANDSGLRRLPIWSAWYLNESATSPLLRLESIELVEFEVVAGLDERFFGEGLVFVARAAGNSQSADQHTVLAQGHAAAG